MMTACPSRADRPGASRRAAVSFAPPAGNGTTTLIGRCGNGWAKQEPANTGMAQSAMNADRAMREWTHHRLSAIIGTLSGLRRNPVRNPSEFAVADSDDCGQLFRLKADS